MKLSRHFAVLIPLAGAVVLAGCSQVTIKSFRFLGVPEPPPTDPAQVQILRLPPLRRFERLGRIDAVPESDDVDNEKIEAAIRKAAAKMGADAVIIGFQGERPMGFSIQGFPGDAEARRRMGRVIVGTAIKFRWE
jgi:hypothetical protein